MTNVLLHAQAKKQIASRPDVRPGFTVRVHQKVEEGGKQRIQVFEGLVIGVHRGHTAADITFTVRRIASGVGVERIFPLHSPLIDKIEVKKVAKVRRAKLNFLRGRHGKSARLSERFTTADEFSAAASPSEEAAQDDTADVAVENAEEQVQSEAPSPSDETENAEAKDASGAKA